MSALALSTTQLQEIPDAILPQLAPRIFSMLMSTDQAADYLRSLGIPFGKRKLSAARSGHCNGPPVFRWIGPVAFYLKADITEWARREYPQRMLINPWRED